HARAPRCVLRSVLSVFLRRWPERLGAEQVAEWRRSGTMQVFHYGEGQMRPLSFKLLEDGARYEDFPDFRQPALIFHGAKDDVVPASYSQEFAATHANRLLKVLDSGNELTDVVDYMARKVEAFLL